MTLHRTIRPRVSVILTAYNEQEFIERSVRSILTQTFADFELIIIDDGSTDGTWRMIAAFDDPRIRREQLGRAGRNRALNHGLSLARGEFVAIMDADDESLPERLERQVNFFDATPDVSILGTTYCKYDSMRQESYVRRYPETDKDIRRAMALYIPICHGTVMFRKAVVDTTGGYAEDIPDEEDLDLWLRAAPHFKFANLGPPPAYIYHFDPRHSYFEATLGRLRRVWNGMKLNVRAVRQLGLPRYYYVAIAGKVLYSFALPDGLKRIARKLLAGFSEDRLHPRGRRGDDGATESIEQWQRIGPTK